MDQVNDFFASMPWDELKDESSKAAMSADAVDFFQSLHKSPTKKAKLGDEEPHADKNSPVIEKAKSPRSNKPFYPRMSDLNAKEQALYLAARYGPQAASQSQSALLQRLHPLVLAEQKEFIDWAAGVTSHCLPHSALLTNPPFQPIRQPSAPCKELALRNPSLRAVHLRPIKHLHSEGRVPVCRPLENLGCLSEEIQPGKSSHAISSDPVAARLAAEHSADVILSPGALVALVDSASSDLHISLTVKEVKGTDDKIRRVLLLDKPVSAIGMSDHQRVQWAAKRAANSTFFSFKNQFFSFDSMKVEKDKTFIQQLQNYAASKGSKEGEVNCNHTYSLWCLEQERILRTADSAWGRQGCPVRLLVRSRCHGYQERQQVAPLYVHLAVKLEWRPQLGAEAITLSEATRDWVALTFRPEALLLRARVDVSTMQVIQVEPKDLKTVSAEARLRGLDSAKTLGALHTLFAELLKLPVGQFLLRVEPRRACLHVYDLASPGQMLDQNQGIAIKTDESFSGGLIDPDVVTPWCLQNQRVPAMFPPRSDIQPKAGKAFNKKKKKKKKSNC